MHNFFRLSRQAAKRSLLALALVAGLSLPAMPQARLTTRHETDGARVVVNFPAYRLYLYHGPELIKTYRIGIGMKSFQPVFGEMLAPQIIYNPSWTPPDSPWARGRKRTRPNQRGNPLGRVKLPLYGDYLIHGGARPSDLGRAVSHGCVRMLNVDVLDLSRRIAEIQNGAEGQALARRAERVRGRSVPLKLDAPLVVDFRYDLATIEPGQRLRLYPDVYRFGMDRRQAVEAALDQARLSWGDLTEKQRAIINRALKQPRQSHTISLSDEAPAAKRRRVQAGDR